MSPPDTKAISERSGDNAGSAKLGRESPEALLFCATATAWLKIGWASKTASKRTSGLLREFIVSLRSGTIDADLASVLLALRGRYINKGGGKVEGRKLLKFVVRSLGGSS
jgi:hypothetical protein